MSLFSLFVASVFGVSFVRLIAFRTRRIAVLLCVGPALGLGILSIVALACLLVFDEMPPFYRDLEAVLAGGVALAAIGVEIRMRRSIAARPAQSSDSPAWLRAVTVALSVFVVLQVITSGFLLALAYALAPDGLWDAWGIWNVCAKQIFAGGDQWRLAFSESAAHPDYPLFLPLTVVRAWTWGGDASTSASFSAAVFFFVSLIGLLFAALQALRDTQQALLASIVLLSTTSLQVWAGSQYADVPLSFLYLATFVVMAFVCQTDESPGSWLVLLGITLSGAAWMKNEGLAWCVANLPAIGYLIWSQRGRLSASSAIARLLVGMAPIGAAMLIFKLKLAAQSNDLVAGQTWETFGERIMDAARHQQILQMALQVAPIWTVWLFGWAILIGFRGADRPMFVAGMFAFSLLGILGVYYLVYLTTPHDLAWHLGTSIDRLVVQVWPAILFGFFYFVRTPTEAMRTGAKEASEPAPGGLVLTA